MACEGLTYLTWGLGFTSLWFEVGLQGIRAR